MKNKNIFAFFSFVVLSIFMLTDCSSKYELTQDDMSNNSMQLYTQADSIADLHNQVLAYVYGTSGYSGSGIFSLNHKHLSVQSSNLLKNDILNFATYKGWDLSNVDQAFSILDSLHSDNNVVFIENNESYIKDYRLKLKNILNSAVGRGYVDNGANQVVLALIDSVDSGVEPERLVELVNNIDLNNYSGNTAQSLAVFKTVTIGSYNYWNNTSNPGTDNFQLRRDSWVMIGDGAGAIIGTMYGGYWSIVCSAYASVYLNETLVLP